MTEDSAEKPYLIFFAMIACNFLFACMQVFIKLASQTQDIAQIMFFRNAFGLVPVAILIALSGGFSLLRTKRPLGHFLRSTVGTFSMTFFFLSFKLLPLGYAVTLQNSSPLILTLLSIPLLGEKVGPHRIIAVLVGLCAVIYMMNPAVSGHVSGNMIALTAAVSAAFVMIIIRRLGRTEHHLTIVFYFMLFGAIVTGLVSALSWTMPAGPALFYLIMVGLLGGGGQIMMTYAYANAPAAYVSAFSYSGILFAAFFDWAVWGHIMAPATVIGSTVIISTGLFILYRESLKHKNRPIPLA